MGFFQRLLTEREPDHPRQYRNLPTLQTIRRPLTPRHSVAGTSSSNARFFIALPFELRAAILCEAFGGRVLHMNLEYNDGFRSADGPHASARKGIERGQYNSRGNGNMTWLSSVCHRTTPELFGTRWDPGALHDPCHDYRRGVPKKLCCADFPRNAYGQCSIGAMGWLRTCRQAYVEGLDVLYASNTIRIQGTLLTTHLGRCLLQQRLNNIRSVELVWSFAPEGENVIRRTTFTPADDYSKELLQMLRTTRLRLPNLRKVFIGLTDQMWRTWEAPVAASKLHTWIERAILLPVDALVRELVRLRQMEFAIPASLYSPLREQCKGAPLENGSVVLRDDERFWRGVCGAHATGYWITISVTDAKLDETGL